MLPWIRVLGPDGDTTKYLEETTEVRKVRDSLEGTPEYLRESFVTGPITKYVDVRVEKKEQPKSRDLLM